MFGQWLHSQSRYQIFHTFLAVCLLIATLAFAIHALGLLYDGRYSVTRQDYWRIYKLDLEVPFPLNTLYKHNDHPLLFPSLVWLPILYFFHNNQTLLFFCGLVITLTTLIIILVSLWRSPSLGLLSRLAIALISTVACLWLGRANILASGGFNAINSMTLGAVLAGLLALDRLPTTSRGATRRQLFAVSVAAGIVATFSFGTGLAVWPAFALIVLLYRLGWKMAGALGTAGILSAAIVIFLPNNGETDLDDALSRLWPEWRSLIGRFCEVLGAPWINYGSGWLFPARITSETYLFAGAIGALGLLLGLYFLIARHHSTRTPEPAETVALGTILFIAGSIALIVIGRGGVITANQHAVLASRYFYWSTIFWAALPVLVLYRWPRLRGYPTTLSLLALLLAAGALPSQLQIGDEYRETRRATEDAASRIICGLEDEPSLQQLFKGPTSSVNRIRPLASIYRERGLDMFAWPGASLVGKFLPPPTKSRSEEPKLLGDWQVDRVEKTIQKDQPGAHFSGWCLTRKTHRRPEYVLICQENGKVVGLARFTVDEPARNEKYRLSARHVISFEGYIGNYSSKERYRCLAEVDGKLISQALRRIGPDSGPDT